MVGFFQQNILVTIGLLDYAYAMPGFHAQVLRRCPESGLINGVRCDAASNQIPKQATTTYAPELVANLAIRDAKFTSVACADNGTCAVWNVTSSLITTLDVNSLVPSTTAPITSASFTSIDNSSTAPASASFANNTITGPSLPTSTGFSNSTTSAGTNSTTQLTSTITLSVTTITDVSWINWDGSPTGLSNGSAISTASGPYSNNTSTRANMTTSTDNASSITGVPKPSGFNSTLSYVFSGTTYVIPVPDSYSSTIPTVNASTTSSGSFFSVTPLPTLGSTAFTTCYTSSKFTTASNNVSGIFVTSFPDSNVCYGLECSNSSCSEFTTISPLNTSNSTTSSNNKVSSVSNPGFAPLAISSTATTIKTTAVDDEQLTSTLVYTDSAGITQTSLFTFSLAPETITATPISAWNQWTAFATSSTSNNNAQPSSTLSSSRLTHPVIRSSNNGYKRRAEIVQMRKEYGRNFHLATIKQSDDGKDPSASAKRVWKRWIPFVV